jgi:hypothetical protein
MDIFQNLLDQFDMDIFQNLLDHYKDMYGPGDAALVSLDNDILLTLNEGVSGTIQYNEYVYDYIMAHPEPHVDNVYYLWYMLGKEQQVKVYNNLM